MAKKTNNNKKEVKLFDKQEVIIQVIGATMNGTWKPLEKLFVQFEKTEPEIAFACVAGLLFIKTHQNKEEYNNDDELGEKAINRYYEDHFGAGFLLENINRLDKLLILGLEKKPTPFLLSKYPDPQIFWNQVFSEIIEDVFRFVLAIATKSGYWASPADDAFAQIKIIEKVLYIINTHGLGNSKVFFKAFRKRCETVIDESLQRNFTSSVSKIWDARRAALNYFLDQLIFCNMNIPPGYLKDLDTRRKAWFILESKYKRENKKVKRDLLRSEFEEVLKLITQR